MEKTRNWKRNALIVVQFVAVLVIVFGRFDGYSKKEAMLMDQVKTGMDTNQVIGILGLPDSKNYSADSTLQYEYFTSNKAWSTLPLVQFDSVGKVNCCSYHIKE